MQEPEQQLQDLAQCLGIADKVTPLLYTRLKYKLAHASPGITCLTAHMHIYNSLGSLSPKAS